MSEAGATALVCPKCRGAMRSYERNGVTIDQCTECRGIFLDRGELEQLVDAESTYYERSRGDQHEGDEHDAPKHRGDRHGGDEHDAPKHRRKRGGFLGDFFE